MSTDIELHISDATGVYISTIDFSTQGVHVSHGSINIAQNDVNIAMLEWAKKRIEDELSLIKSGKQNAPAPQDESDYYYRN